MQEASQYNDLTSNSFQDIQRRIESSIQSIHPSEEYREFTERHKYVNAVGVIQLFFFQFFSTISLSHE